jgi:hypothetical protein
MRRTTLWAAMIVAAGLSASVAGPAAMAMVAGKEVQSEAVDRRQYLHGVNLVPVDERYLLVFSSNSYPPRHDTQWNHDIFYSWIDPSDPQLDVHLLIRHDEAQEPASAAINSQGKLLITNEDGSDGINQFASLWNSDLTPIRSYPDMLIRRGGHSGHAAALHDRFLVVYGEEWIKEGGVDDLGTGDDVWGRIIDGKGRPGPEIEIAVGDETRDWWPIVAASDAEALVVWQRYQSEDDDDGNRIEGASLEGAIVDATGSVRTRLRIASEVDFYVYDVRYVPSLRLYLVLGSDSDGGFGALIDPAGRIVAQRHGLPRTIREAGTAITGGQTGATAVYPTAPTGVAVLSLGNRSINLVDTIAGEVEWDGVGTDGIFVAPNKVLFAAGSIDGIHLVSVDLDTDAAD